MKLINLDFLCRLLFAAGILLVATSGKAQILPKDPAKRSGLNFEFRESVSSRNAQGVNVLTGADYLYTSTPQIMDVNLRKSGQSALWKPGDAVWEVPRRRGTPAIVNPRAANQAPWIDPIFVS